MIAVGEGDRGALDRIGAVGNRSGDGEGVQGAGEVQAGLVDGEVVQRDRGRVPCGVAGLGWSDRGRGAVINAIGIGAVRRRGRGVAVMRKGDGGPGHGIGAVGKRARDDARGEIEGRARGDEGYVVDPVVDRQVIGVDHPVDAQDDGAAGGVCRHVQGRGQRGHGGAGGSGSRKYRRAVGRHRNMTVRFVKVP